MPRHCSTYIGIALYDLFGFPTQWVILLSSCQRFDSNVWCGTIIDSVNGWVQNWTKLESSPATFAPQLSFVGVIMVGKVDRLPTDLKQSIISRVTWREQPLRNGDSPPSDDYVHRVILYLSREKIISLPRRVIVHFAEHIEERRSRLQERLLSRINHYAIIPILEGDLVIGRTKV